MSNRIVHFEIPYDDPDRATGFYRELFGWNMQAMPELDYMIVMTGPVSDEGMPTEVGFINGGMFKRQEPFGPPVLVVQVDDIDKTLEQISSLNGSTVSDKQAVGEMGFAAYFKDPEGNLMGLWQNVG